MKRNVFYSFQFEKDVLRVQQIRNMGVIDGDEPVSPNRWEEIRRTDEGVKRWITENLQRKTCLVVLIGEKTAASKWVRFEIAKAWELGIPVVGVRIHNLKCPRAGVGVYGVNPFNSLTLKRANGTVYTPKVYDPSAHDAYGIIKANLAGWIETAIRERA
ncbi:MULTISPECIES: TIR domain-containing protein [Pseudomonas]|uniref:TIR domain-containing protein n=1 Tax=Pseudomonas capeferrum TaxID=1495066 RepID=A0ABY7R674_9PSED|nr:MULTISPECIES: TIR domain-containing protein [Pseudomonas]MUT50477.1 TIR domain-containing protein [Pseudomonas sp. TDA1]WCH99267.1 TIR domain-containing protein [Pseudomonas capeferrum]